MNAIKLAGVTFDNRQKVLEIIYNKKPGRIVIVAMIETTYDGERAVQCVDEKAGTCLGWVPKTELKAHPAFPEKMRIRVDKYKGTYHAVIEETKPPTSKMYFAVKNICSAKKMTMPAYDEAAYRAVIISSRKEK